MKRRWRRPSWRPGAMPVRSISSSTMSDRAHGSAPASSAISSPEVWRFVLNVSLFSTLLCSRQVAPHMRQRGTGKIVNISSHVAFTAEVGLADYAAAKMGVLGFTRSLARELAPHGVNVNAICPGAVNTRVFDRVSDQAVAELKQAIPMHRFAGRRRSAASSCSSPAATATSSPASRSSSTAVNGCSERGQPRVFRRGRPAAFAFAAWRFAAASGLKAVTLISIRQSNMKSMRKIDRVGQSRLKNSA